MIVVRVELWSARTGERTELARMRISNDGSGTAREADYFGATHRGRSTAVLDRGVVQRSGVVQGFPRQSLHVWHLVSRMLAAMGYGGATPINQQEEG